MAKAERLKRAKQVIDEKGARIVLWGLWPLVCDLPPKLLARLVIRREAE